jgi:hypothetical protein
MDSVWGSTSSVDKPRALDEESYTDEENKVYFEKKMKKYEERIHNSVPIGITINGNNQQVMEKANTSNASTDSTEKTEEDDYVWKL